MSLSYDLEILKLSWLEKTSNWIEEFSSHVTDDQRVNLTWTVVKLFHILPANSEGLFFRLIFQCLQAQDFPTMCPPSYKLVYKPQ